VVAGRDDNVTTGILCGTPETAECLLGQPWHGVERMEEIASDDNLSWFESLAESFKALDHVRALTNRKLDVRGFTVSDMQVCKDEYVFDKEGTITESNVRERVHATRWGCERHRPADNSLTR